MSKYDIGFSSCFKNGVDEGPCYFDEDCKDTLFCGYKNCPATVANDSANCCGRNQFKSPNYPNSFFSNAEKTWLITAAIGSIIILEFHSVNVRLIVKSIKITSNYLCENICYVKGWR